MLVITHSVKILSSLVPFEKLGVRFSMTFVKLYASGSPFSKLESTYTSMTYARSDVDVFRNVGSIVGLVDGCNDGL